jgi:formamidopyrimidine-DNA glycosylase
MPELPEVEIVRQSLDKKVKQKKVKKVIVRNRNLRLKIPSNFESFLMGKKIIKVKRFSKYLILCLSNNSYCLLHLGMSGTVHIVKDNKKELITNTSFYNSPFLPKRHNHVEIIFENLKVVYNDPRRFGFFQILENKYLLNKRFSKLGPEPFQSEFNLEYIFTFFKGKKKNIN